jgi:hypothetical protein
MFDVTQKEGIEMSPKSRREYLAAIHERYHQFGKSVKTQILDEFCQVCGYHRKHALRLLNRPWPAAPARKSGPAPRYDEAVLAPLKAIWLAADQPCSKRLVGALPIWLPAWEKRHGVLESSVRRRLLAISPATVDRLLRPVRVRIGGRGRTTTKPGSLLRQQIPIRAEAWDTDQPGYLEADTVAHCGESFAGSFIWSITYTDIFSGWTACRATWNRGAAGVIEQTRRVEAMLPFAIMGFDCDNGSEFINQHLVRYFAQRRRPVQFTRCRPYKKNDQAHVEQKNWTHVRQLLGYGRLDRPELVEAINGLYELRDRLANFFIPNLKLLEKRREGARTIKRYAPALTPCQRLLESPHIAESVKNRLRREQYRIDPFALKKQIECQLRLVFDRQRDIDGLTRSRPPALSLK